MLNQVKGNLNFLLPLARVQENESTTSRFSAGEVSSTDFWLFVCWDQKKIWRQENSL